MIEGVGQVTETLFIGGAGSVTRIDELRDSGVTYILKLYFDEPIWPSDFVVCDNAIDDGVFIDRETLETGVQFVREAISDGHKVLVVCGLEISRSATFVLAYLLDQGMDLHDAFQLVSKARPQVWPMRDLWTSLITHYNAPYTLAQIEEWRTKSERF